MSENNHNSNGHSTNGHKNGNHTGERRRYSDKERATILAALAANGGNVLRTSRDTGVPRKTVELWSKEQANGTLLPAVAEECQEKREVLADYLESVAWKLAKALPDRIEKAALRDIATSFGIVTDKMRLLREQATSIAGDNRGVEAAVKAWQEETGGSREDAIHYLAPHLPEVKELGKIG